VKILHLLYESKGDYFGIGGVGMRAYEIYSRLKNRHDITLVCKKYPGAEDKEIAGLRHIFVGTESKSLTKCLLSYARDAAYFVRQYGNDFDLVVEEFSPAIPLLLPRFFKTKPVILQVQGFTGNLYFKKYNSAYALFLFLSERVRPHLYSNFIFITRDTARKLSISNKKHVEIIPNGI